MTDLENIGDKDLDLDFDNLFSDDFLPDDLYIFDGHDGKTPNSSYPSDNAASLSIGEIENILLNDDFQTLADQDTDAFWSQLLVDSPPPNLDAGSDSSASVSPSPPLESKDSSPCSSDEKGHPHHHHHLHPPEHKNHVHSDNAIDENDPDAKKRKRQLRNKDAAVRSRERKKMYVRDLEMKSRYYETECRRLEWILQCVRAENHALQFALHTNNHQAFGTSTKQESAVLLLESLLLGSLLWLMGIIGLFILPRQLLAILEAALLENVEGKNQTSLAPKKVVSDVFGMPVLQFFMKSKRWRGSRTRMKVYIM